ncbi:FkbM family methyltransferase [Synechococcus sp. AH-551-C10]|nr:FkbM family methyltransferase [Synechococcus sp. AH-551-C10]MDB4659653.1 FkbM family methyltransferase [Synechococcus sp. AH-551-C10]
MGSADCGWSFVDTGDLSGSTIVSAGLGEDGSFDLEFAQRYNARVIIVDPTPRAIKHFNEISSNLGATKSQSYNDSGKQPVQAYDLKNIHSDKLILVKKALYNKNTLLKFFQPLNPQHVSYSISNYQHGYRADTPFLEVESTTIPELLSDLEIDLNELSLIKLDIEGAEIEVLIHCISNGILPKQILVEFDELNAPSKKGYNRVNYAHQVLIRNGYEMIKTDGQADFLYLRVD